MPEFSATEANRSFSKLMRLVSEGKEVRITSHGKRFAVLKPDDTIDAEDAARRRESIERLNTRWADTEFTVIEP